MKTISTQYRDDEIVDYPTLLQRLNHLTEEEFITLVDDKSGNFIQTTFADEDNPDSDFLVEMRLYQGDDFEHYQKTVADFDQVIQDFYAFYHDSTNYDYQLAHWQNITDTFFDVLTLDSRLGGECYDGCIATLESVMGDVQGLAEFGEADDFVHIFDDSKQLTPCSLVIYPNFANQPINYWIKFVDNQQQTFEKEGLTIMEIEKLVLEFLTSYSLNIQGWE